MNTFLVAAAIGAVIGVASFLIKLVWAYARTRGKERQNPPGTIG